MKIRKNTLMVCFLTAMTFLAALQARAQRAVIEESLTDIRCDSPTQAYMRFRQQTRILNEQGAQLASFVCSVSDKEQLSSFQGVVTDNAGRVIRKLRQRDLKRTEYSEHLAVDEYKLYVEYTPPTYPVTVTYEWAITCSDNLIEFPPFCPQADYDVSVRKAVYRLSAPKRMDVRYALQNIQQPVVVDDSQRYTTTFSLELNDLSAIRSEAYARPLVERCPLAFFAPSDFTYYGSKGSLRSWKDYGLWEYGLINGTEALPDATCQRLHQLTDHLATDREKVEALYQELGRTTRYVAILLGIGGQRPAPAAAVCHSGFGDCKGLSNLMRAMLKEVGIASYYTTVNTQNRWLLPEFASVGQLNHVVLEVPLQGDTLWLECTNPQLPVGYVHSDIAGHDAVEISPSGGRLVRIPAYADSANLMRSTVGIQIEPTGAANVALSQTYSNRQYEQHAYLPALDGKEQQKQLQRIIQVLQPEIDSLGISQDGAKVIVNAAVRSQKYATATGQRLFIPACPLRRHYRVPDPEPDRREDVWLAVGYCDEDDITLLIPEGYVIEALPQSVTLEKPFGTFHSTIRHEGQTIRITNRLLMRSGCYAKAVYPELATFIKAVTGIYNQKIVIKKS